MTIYLDETHISATTRGAISQSRAQSRAQSDVILAALAKGAQSASELIQVLGLASKTGSFKRTIKLLLEENKIEYTLPGKPRSRMQKYKLV